MLFSVVLLGGKCQRRRKIRPRGGAKVGHLACLAPFLCTRDLGFYLGGFGDWWAHAKGVMWPDVVVLREPLVDDGLGLPCCCEPFGGLTEILYQVE